MQAGLPLRLGMDCYDFAATIQPLQRTPDTPDVAYFHTYWRADLVPFGERQEWMIKSFFATQDPRRSRLVLWSNGDLAAHPAVHKYLRAYPEAFVVREVDYDTLVQGTELEGRQGVWAHAKDRRAWVDGDLVRLLVLWAYGGVWVDMDTLLTRAIEPLLEHEFVTQWDCFGTPSHVPSVSLGLTRPSALSPASNSPVLDIYASSSSSSSSILVFSWSAS